MTDPGHYQRHGETASGNQRNSGGQCRCGHCGERVAGRGEWMNFKRPVFRSLMARVNGTGLTVSTKLCWTRTPMPPATFRRGCTTTGLRCTCPTGRCAPCSRNEPGQQWRLPAPDSTRPHQPRAKHPHRYPAVPVKETVPEPGIGQLHTNTQFGPRPVAGVACNPRVLGPATTEDRAPVQPDSEPTV